MNFLPSLSNIHTTLCSIINGNGEKDRGNVIFIYSRKYVSMNLCLSVIKLQVWTCFGLVFFAGLAVTFAAGVKKEGDNFKVDYSLECINRTRAIISRSWLEAALEYPSGIRSDTIGCIGYRLVSFLGCLGWNEKFLKRPNFCLSMLLFWVVFSTFCL